MSDPESNRGNMMENKSPRIVAVTICRFVIFLAVQHMIGIVLYQVINVAALMADMQFRLHIIFSVIGYQLLLVQAIASFNSESLWMQHFPRTTVRMIHLVLAALGGVFSFVGGVLMMARQGGQFTSAHGICGLIAMLFSLLSTFNGLMTYFSPKLRNKVKPAVVKAVHTVCGMGSITMGLVTLCIGINKGIFLIAVLGNQQIVSTLTAFVILILIYVLLHPLSSMVRYVSDMRTTAL